MVLDTFIMKTSSVLTQQWAPPRKYVGYMSGYYVGIYVGIYVGY